MKDSVSSAPCLMSCCLLSRFRRLLLNQADKFTAEEVCVVRCPLLSHAYEIYGDFFVFFHPNHQSRLKTFRWTRLSHSLPLTPLETSTTSPSATSSRTETRRKNPNRGQREQSSRANIIVIKAVFVLIWINGSVLCWLGTCCMLTNITHHSKDLHRTVRVFSLHLWTSSSIY